MKLSEMLIMSGNCSVQFIADIQELERKADLYDTVSAAAARKVAALTSELRDEREKHAALQKFVALSFTDPDIVELAVWDQWDASAKVITIEDGSRALEYTVRIKE